MHDNHLWEKKRKKGKDFHRRRENCSSSMSRFLLLPLFSNLATAHLGKAIRAARLLFFHTASIWVSEEENQAWLVSLKKRSENGQKDDGSSVTIKAMNVVSERCLETTHILWKCISARMCAISPLVLLPVTLAWHIIFGMGTCLVKATTPSVLYKKLCFLADFSPL